MKVELSEVEMRELGEALDRQLAGLMREIVRTDHRAYRGELSQRYDRIEVRFHAAASSPSIPSIVNRRPSAHHAIAIPPSMPLMVRSPRSGRLEPRSRAMEASGRPAQSPCVLRDAACGRSSGCGLSGGCGCRPHPEGSARSGERLEGRGRPPGMDD